MKRHTFIRTAIVMWIFVGLPFLWASSAGAAEAKPSGQAGWGKGRGRGKERGGSDDLRQHRL